MDLGNETPRLSLSALAIRKKSVRLVSDSTRVITRFFMPGGPARSKVIVDRILALSEAQAKAILASIEANFSSRHKDLRRVFDEHYRLVAKQTGCHGLTGERSALIGAYFSCEYSLESVALFNPSIIAHPDQAGLPSDSVRFIVSLRSCGEGHVSSISFRTGVIDSSHEICLSPPSRFAAAERPVADRQYRKRAFFLKLIEMGAYRPIVESILDRLDDQFTFDLLRAEVEAERQSHGYVDGLDHSLDNILWLARSNYHLAFPLDSRLSERVIFPVSENESRGIEDARFVRFVDQDGEVIYYATYAAYNGIDTLPQLIETTDFIHFKISTLSGKCVQNKGLALFPRKINGQYVMLGRIDGESTFLLTSDNVYFWNEAKKIQEPLQPWEFVQVGNCGSPIETRAGWLVLTHGVGAMRRYCMGAMLLDLQDPSRILGRLPGPLIEPADDERDGYVPNVVYSCGGLVHHGELIIPYAISDTSTGIITVGLDDLLSCMRV